MTKTVKGLRFIFLTSDLWKLPVSTRIDYFHKIPLNVEATLQHHLATREGDMAIGGKFGLPSAFPRSLSDIRIHEESYCLSSHPFFFFLGFYL